MTSTHHGDTTLTQDVFEGAMAFVIDFADAQIVADETGHAKLIVSDRQFRDLMLCGGDLVPSMLPMREPARVGTEVLGHDNGVPIRTLNLPEKPCGCGVLLGEVCDCVGTPPPVWGQTR